jgi:hypothetical protein
MQPKDAVASSLDNSVPLKIIWAYAGHRLQESSSHPIALCLAGEKILRKYPIAELMDCKNFYKTALTELESMKQQFSAGY